MLHDDTTYNDCTIGLPSTTSGLPVLDIVHGEALGGQPFALSTAGARPVALWQLFPLQAHAQQVEAPGTAVTQH